MEIGTVIGVLFVLGALYMAVAYLTNRLPPFRTGKVAMQLPTKEEEEEVNIKGGMHNDFREWLDLERTQARDENRDDPLDLFDRLPPTGKKFMKGRVLAALRAEQEPLPFTRLYVASL